jgi:hypothetical protein
MEDTDLRRSVQSSQFRESSLAIVGLAFTHIADSVVDFFSSTTSAHLRNKTRQEADDNKKRSIITEYERWVFCIGVVLVPVIALLPTSTARLALAYTCATRSQILVLGGYVVIACSSRYPVYFPLPATLFTLVACWVATVISPWILNISREVTTARLVIYYLEWAGIVVYFACALWWVYCEVLVRLVVPRLRRLVVRVVAWDGRSNAPGRQGSRNGRKGSVTGSGGGHSAGSIADAGQMRVKHAESSVFFPIAYVLVAFVWMVFTGIVISLTANLYDTTERDLLLLNLPIILFQVTMMLLSSQFSKFEVVENLYALLDSKKSYVRYIR